MTSSARPLAALLALLALPAAAAGQGVAAPLAAAVADSVAARWGLAASAVRLEWGTAPAAMPAAGAVRLVGTGHDGWFVAVLEPAHGDPVALRVRAGSLDSVPVAARPIAAQTLIGPEDVRVEVRARWGAPTRGRSPRPAGLIARRPLAAGEALVAPAVGPAPAVRAGETVRVEWRRGVVALEFEGTALGAAAAGEPVAVRLAGRPGQRSAVVTAPGTVRLTS